MTRAHARNREAGISFIELLLAAALVALVSLTAVTYVTRGAQHTTWMRDRVFARQKAMAMLEELRAFVDSADRGVAADLDPFDDGDELIPTLSIARDPRDPSALMPPEDPASGNMVEVDRWRWHRQISVRPFPGVPNRELRICTVRIFRTRHNDALPGEQMAELSTVIRSIGDTSPSTHVYDVYLLALENVPGWWVSMDSVKPFVNAALADLESRNPGLKFRAHWITKLGYGRDEEYAPYTNRVRDSQEPTPWVYVYPGGMPAKEAAASFYVPEHFQARMNLDGVGPIDKKGKLPKGTLPVPEFINESSGANPEPYALADMHNHCMRYPEAVEKFRARFAAGSEELTTPTWRLLLDTMILEPQRFHNAIFINLHGELLPMPPVRNYSDAAADPETRPGWRVVTHPERLVSTRVEGSDAQSKAPVFRVYAWKSDFLGDAGKELLMSQGEPFQDLDRDGVHDAAEPYEDWNDDGTWTAALPISIMIGAADFSAAPNAAKSPSIVVESLAGGIDADASGANDAYAPFRSAPRLPEPFVDSDGDGVRAKAEVYFDLDGNNVRDAHDPFQELDGNGRWSPTSETLTDGDGDGDFDPAAPAETFTDGNGNGRWDPAEPYWDRNGNGRWDGPTASKDERLPWQPWNHERYGNVAEEDRYVVNFGEPFLDIDGDKTFDEAEAFKDNNGNGVRDGGYERGQMWFGIRFDATRGTVLELHGTPLETPHVGGQGLPERYRLYDLDYVPCPTPAGRNAADRFARDLASAGDVPKNTARWRITLPSASVRRVFESSVGANDGDAEDLLLSVETRLGSDLATGTMWPTRHAPRNASRTHTYLFADPEHVPFSERYQFRGDPRHSPYEDTDHTGTTAPNGYNWFWDDFVDGGDDARDAWLAFDPARLRDGWMGRSDHDTPRLLQWLRTGLVESETVWTTLTGLSYNHLSCGGDVGADGSNGFPNGVPMDGLPFGEKRDVFENTVMSGPGSKAVRGSRKFIMYGKDKNKGIRDGGPWWSKPWLGETSDDLTYATQWKLLGNHLAGKGGKSRKNAAKGESSAKTPFYRLVRKDEIPTAQQPLGTVILNAVAQAAEEGCTSMFNVGTRSSTFHHQAAGGQGRLVDDGLQLGANYNFPVPASALINRPFHPATSGDGGVGPEFDYTGSYPRFVAQMVQRYYDHDRAGLYGSGLMKLTAPGAGTRAAWFSISGIDADASGSTFVARYGLLSLLHSHLSAGVASDGHQISQLPHLKLRGPRGSAELKDPKEVTVTWSTTWRRWDGRKYTDAYPENWEGNEADLVYMLLYSKDGGQTWLNMLDDRPAAPGAPDWVSGVGPDPLRSIPDAKLGANETYVWSTPAAKVPEGTYEIRVEAYRKSEGLHYATHQETVHVAR